MRIYTKGGDRGETGLPGARRLGKGETIFDFLGNLDQASALIGLVISYLKKAEQPLIKELKQIQATFLSIGACVAGERPAQSSVLKQLPQLTRKLEQQIDTWAETLPPLRNFILPGGDQAGANLHVIRTFIRQTERDYHRLHSKLIFEPVAIYLNRLSDYFFQAARYHNHQHQIPEQKWEN